MKKAGEELVNSEGHDDDLTQQFVHDLLNNMTRSGNERQKSVQSFMTSVSKEKKGLSALQEEYATLETQIQTLALRLGERIVLPTLPKTDAKKKTSPTTLKEAAALVWILQQLLSWLQLKEIGVKVWVAGGGPVVTQGAMGPILLSSPAPAPAPAAVTNLNAQQQVADGEIARLQRELQQEAALLRATQERVHALSQGEQGADAGTGGAGTAEIARLQQEIQQQAEERQRLQAVLQETARLQQQIQQQKEEGRRLQGAQQPVQWSQTPADHQTIARLQRELQQARDDVNALRMGAQQGGEQPEVRPPMQAQTAVQYNQQPPEVRPPIPAQTAVPHSQQPTTSMLAVVPHKPPDGDEVAADKVAMTQFIRKGFKLQKELKEGPVMAKTLAGMLTKYIGVGLNAADHRDPLPMMGLQKGFTKRAYGTMVQFENHGHLVLPDGTPLSHIVAHPHFAWAKRQLINQQALGTPTRENVVAAFLIDDNYRRLLVDAKLHEAEQKTGLLGKLSQSRADRNRELAVAEYMDSDDYLHCQVNALVLLALEPDKWRRTRLGDVPMTDIIGLGETRETITQTTQQIITGLVKAWTGKALFDAPSAGKLVASVAGAAGAGWGWQTFLNSAVNVGMGVMGLDGTSKLQVQGIGLGMSGAASMAQGVGSIIDHIIIQRPRNEKEARNRDVADYSPVKLLQAFSYNIAEPAQLTAAGLPAPQAIRGDQVQLPLTAEEQLRLTSPETQQQELKVKELQLKLQQTQAQALLARAQQPSTSGGTQGNQQQQLQAEAHEPGTEVITEEEPIINEPTEGEPRVPGFSPNLRISYDPGTDPDFGMYTPEEGAQALSRPITRSQTRKQQANQRRGMMACISRRGPGAKARLPCRSRR